MNAKMIELCISAMQVLSAPRNGDRENDRLVPYTRDSLASSVGEELAGEMWLLARDLEMLYPGLEDREKYLSFRDAAFAFLLLPYAEGVRA